MDLCLKRVDRIYRPGDLVEGVVVATSPKGTLSHKGITITMEGVVTLQLSARSIGLFDAFYNSLKPVQLVSQTAEVCKAGKLPEGSTEIPFEFRLEAVQGAEFNETYHGVFVNVAYNMRVDCQRGMLAKPLQKVLEFIVELPPRDPPVEEKKFDFCVTPESLQNIKKTAVQHIPKFKISGNLRSTACHIGSPLAGQLIVEESDAIIKSVEVQLVRVETCGCADGWAKEATEIQNIQVCEGDVCRNLYIPIFMVFPRLFTCPTSVSKTFKIEFEVNLIVQFANGHMISENIPIVLYR